jgi:hypothetical protein
LRRAMLTHESRTPQSVVKYGMPASAIPYQATIQLIFGFIGLSCSLCAAWRGTFSEDNHSQQEGYEQVREE